MVDFLGFGNNSEHGKAGFNGHPVIPSAFLAHFDIIRKPILATEAIVSQHNGLFCSKPSNISKKVVSASFMVAQSQPTTCPTVLSIQHSFMPTLQRPLSLFLPPSCC